MPGWRMRCLAIAGGVLLAILSTMSGVLPTTDVAAQATVERKARVKPSPVFPEVARRLKLSGTVKIQVTVAPNGTVISAKAVGGHPLLVESAMDAVKKWRFEAAAETTMEVIPFEFRPDAGN